MTCAPGFTQPFSSTGVGDEVDEDDDVGADDRLAGVVDGATVRVRPGSDL